MEFNLKRFGDIISRMENREVVILPRAGAGRGIYKSLIYELTRAGFDPVFLAGYMGSLTLAPKPIDEFANELKQYVGRNTVSILADSVGCIHAAKFAARHPDAVEKAVYSNPAFVNPRFRGLYKTLLSLPYRTKCLLLDIHPQVSTVCKTVGHAFYLACLGEIADFRLPELDMKKTTIVKGGRDWTGFLVSNNLPKQTIQEGGHGMMDMYPEYFVAALSAKAQSLSRSSA